MKIAFEKLDPRGIPLREILQAHRGFAAPESLPENLGDGFLFAMNPIYRNVRLELLRLGFSFTQEDFCHYFSFPLMSLDEVIAARRIPYRNNIYWVETLARASFTLTELKRSELQFNYLFHESAHCIAHAVLFGRKHLRELPKNAGVLLRVLMGEAFANTVECLSALHAEGEIEAYFLDANCHFRTSAKEVQSIARAAKEFGFPAVSKALFVAFLYANYLYEGVGEAELRRISRFTEISKPAVLRALLRIGFTLSKEFRVGTTQLHLMKVGFPADLKKWMGDPLRQLEGDPALVGALERLLRVLAPASARK